MRNVIIAERLMRLRGTERRAELAARLGVTVSAIAMYERGERIPRDDVKLKYARLYHKSVDEIFYS